MSTTISSVAIHVVGRYNEAGKTLVSAYRVGGHRLLDGTAARYESAQKVTEFLGTTLDTNSDRVIAVLDRVAAASTSGIETVATRAAKIESPVATSVLKTVTAINLPIVNFTAQIADQLAAGAKQLEARVAGGEPQEVVAPIKTKAVAKRKAPAKAARRVKSAA